MDKVTIIPGETLADIAVKHLGSTDAWLQIATINSLSPTATLIGGQILQLPEKSEQPKNQKETKRATNARIGIVAPGQTWADLSVQYLGATDGWIALVKLNNASLTTEPIPGTVINLPPIVERRVAKYMKEGNHKPATEKGAYSLDGIDYMGIEYTFAVR